VRLSRSSLTALVVRLSNADDEAHDAHDTKHCWLGGEPLIVLRQSNVGYEGTIVIVEANVLSMKHTNVGDHAKSW
jgi:hypothetical protein